MKMSRTSGVLLLTLLACAPPPSSPAGGGLMVPGARETARSYTRDHVTDEERWEFWMAVAELDLRRAERRAPDVDHRRFIRAMQSVLDGRMDQAEPPLARLAQSATDSVLRDVSHVTLSAALEYQGKWAALDDIVRERDRVPVNPRVERVAIEAWAGTMRLAPTAAYDFPSQPVVLSFLPAVTGTPVVNIRVNGVPKWFWIDTGSSVSLIASDVAKEVGVQPLSSDTFHMVTAVSVTPAYPAVIDRLEIGGLIVTGQASAIIDSRHLVLDMMTDAGRTETVKIDGVIGMDILRRVNLRIDFLRNRVTITPPPTLGPDEEKRNLLWLGYPLVRMEQPDGRPLYFGLDTGADRTYATTTLLRKLPKRSMRRQRQRVAGFGADTTVTVPTLPSLHVRIGDRKFILSEVAVHAPRRQAFVHLDGVLGNDTAAGLMMRIDMTNGIFEITLPY